MQMTRLALICALFCVTLGLVETGLGEERGEPQPSDAPVYQVRQLQVYDVLTVPLRLDSRLSVALLAEADGEVRALHVATGSAVREGEPLLQIAYGARESRKRAVQFAPLGVLSPMNGVVGQVLVEPGARVKKGQTLIQVSDPSHQRLVAEVAESQQSLSELEAVLGPGFSIRLGETYEALDGSGRSAEVRLAAGSEKDWERWIASLPTGWRGEAQFHSNRRAAFAVPEHALLYRGKDTFIRVVEQGRARKIAVSVDRVQKGFAEISEGLYDGAQVIESAVIARHPE